MSYHLNVKIDNELHKALLSHAKRLDVEMSAATRDVLRRGLGLVVDNDDAGWREGFTRGVAEMRQSLGKAVKDAMADATNRASRSSRRK